MRSPALTPLPPSQAFSRRRTTHVCGFSTIDQFKRFGFLILVLTTSLLLMGRSPLLIASAYLNAASIDMNAILHRDPKGTRESSGRGIRAVGSMEKALAWNPNEPALHWSMGKALLITADYGNALEALRSSTMLDGGAVLAWFDLGNAYEAQGDRSKALEAWRIARAAPYFRERGWFLFDQQHDYQEALYSYQIATQIDPQDWESWLMVGRTNGQLGEWEDALRATTIVLEAGDAPEEEIRFKALMSLGSWQSYHLQNIEQAVAWFTQAIELRPQEVAPYLEAGYAYEMAGRRAEARQWYRRAEAADPTSEIPNLFIGRTLFADRDDTHAIRDLELATAKGPANQEPYFYLGLIHTRRGDLVEAEKLLKQAIVLIPSESPPQAFSIPYHFQLARILVNAGKLQEAAAEYRHVLALDSDNEIIAQELADLLEAAGR